MKMKKQIFILLAFALILPSAIAFNCNSLSGGDYYVCSSIQNTNLSQTDKDLLISDIFNKNKTSPDFDFIYSWNTNLNIPNSPDGKTTSSGTIRNAWVKIIFLTPSVIENNVLYSTNTGKLRTEYNYGYILPSGKESGDCKTDYSLSGNTATLKVYLNNNLIGNQKISSFSIPENYNDLSFKSELNIQVNYRVTHYRYKWINNYKKCLSYSSEYRTDNLKLYDILNSKSYKNQINSSFKIINNYNNITKGVLTADNFTNLKLSFNNSNYQYNRYVYSLNYTLPYYVLTLTAQEVNNTNFNNIYIEKSKNNFYFTVKDSSECKIQLSDHFNSVTKNCDMAFNETEFSIKTDKTNYYENNTIKVYVFPENITVNITYANESRLVKNYTEFKSVLYENKIHSKLNNKEIDWLINVNKREDAIMVYNLSVLSFFGYVFYKAAKVYYLKHI
jgi:hypothetical protein